MLIGFGNDLKDKAKKYGNAFKVPDVSGRDHNIKLSRTGKFWNFNQHVNRKKKSRSLLLTPSSARGKMLHLPKPIPCTSEMCFFFKGKKIPSRGKNDFFFLVKNRDMGMRQSSEMLL